MSLKCPVCQSPAIGKPTGNGGNLYIGEDDEVFDQTADNLVYYCTDEHCPTTFYMGA